MPRRSVRSFINGGNGGPGRGFALHSLLGGGGGGARFSIPPPLNRTSLFLQAAARVFNGGAAGKSGLAGENTAGYCSKATAGLAAGPLGAFLASHS